MPLTEKLISSWFKSNFAVLKINLKCENKFSRGTKTFFTLPCIQTVTVKLGNNEFFNDHSYEKFLFINAA